VAVAAIAGCTSGDMQGDKMTVDKKGL
jgi:hypothetical protein